MKKGFSPPRYTPLPDEIFDYWLSRLNGSQLRALLYVARRTLGFKKNSDKISLTQICSGIKGLDEGTGLSRQGAIDAMEELERLELVITTRTKKFGKNTTNEYSLNIHVDDSESQDLVVKKLDYPLVQELDYPVVKFLDQQETVLQQTETKPPVPPSGEDFETPSEERVSETRTGRGFSRFNSRPKKVRRRSLCSIVQESTAAEGIEFSTQPSPVQSPDPTPTSDTPDSATGLKTQNTGNPRQGYFEAWNLAIPERAETTVMRQTIAAFDEPDFGPNIGRICERAAQVIRDNPRDSGWLDAYWPLKTERDTGRYNYRKLLNPEFMKPRRSSKGGNLSAAMDTIARAKALGKEKNDASH